MSKAFQRAGVAITPTLRIVDDEDRERFLEILLDYHTRYGILLYSCVLMDSHYHLIP